jgi:serine protease Do
VGLLALGLAACHTPSDGPGAGGPPGAAEALRAGTAAAVRVLPSGGMAQASGSGFVLRADTGEQVIVTNAHVVWGASEIAIETNDHATERATVAGVDPEVDLAVLRPRTKLSVVPLRFESDEALRLGDWLGSVGSPAGVLNAVSVGVLSARSTVPDATVQAQSSIDHLFTDAVLSPGCSGGPLLDARGRVVGVNVAMLGTSRGLGIAIPSHLAAPVVARLLHDGAYPHGRSGIRVADASPGGHVRVVSVAPADAGDEVAIRSGDLILAVDGQSVQNAGDFRMREFMDAPGTRWQIEIERDQQRITTSWVLREWPTAALSPR